MPSNKNKMNPAPFAYSSQGPAHPPIFIGHISQFSDDGQKVGLKNGSKIEYCQELQFAKAVIIEGIHIVPNRISPPGIPDFVGKTRPDLSERPFTLQILGRKADPTLSLEDLFILVAITVNGGVQWLPLASQLQETSWDYLVFKGDYEEVSLILHGVETDTLSIPNPLPYPPHYDKLYSIKENLIKSSISKPSVGEARCYVHVPNEGLEFLLATSLP
ncbi:hypothetical protein EON65_53580, partial [archaeon]